MTVLQKFRFKKFRIYQDARDFRKELKLLSKKRFPKEERFCLTDQLWRALDSIVLNIAEGTDRGSDKDFAHFLNNSHTSLNEVVSILDLASDDEYLVNNEYNLYLEKANNLADQLTAFRKSLIVNPKK